MEDENLHTHLAKFLEVHFLLHKFFLYLLLADLTVSMLPPLLEHSY